MIDLSIAPDFQKIESVFIAMGDKSRRTIVYQIMESSRTIKELAEPLGITITGVSQHIKILEEAKIITTKKLGRERICEFNPAGFEMIESFAKFYTELWRTRFQALKSIVEEDEDQ